MQPLDLARQRLDRTNALRMSSPGMGSQPGDFQFDKGRPFPPRHQIAAWPAGLRIEDGTRVFGFGLNDRARGRRSNFLIRGIEARHGTGRAKTAECFQNEGVHDESGFHIGDPRAKGLVAVDPEGSLGSGAVGENRIAVPHENNRPITTAAGRNARRHAIAKNFIRNGFAGNAGSFEKSPQPIADGIDAAFVVATRVDIHEVGQYPDHRLMLPAEMLENSGSGVDAHA
jgi:hypothetical protein